ncbi:calcitonin receptor-like [Centruroides sculpturatus]|uniref:calcitonin receptor-like n=1 Tax=Centruroides sculpturatus TaxID=218467 RepID=UPI000C6D33C4|nr:calcitonin receptor-like [Centruroides sculpturatus]
MDQLEELQNKKNTCLTNIENSNQPKDGLYCPMIWDGAYCWPHVPAGTLHSVACPDYIHGFNTRAQATKLCMLNGEWWINDKTNQSWTNYSLCTKYELDTFDNLNSYHTYLLKQYLEQFHILPKTT